MIMVLVEVVIGLACLALGVYLLSAWNYSYWRRRGIKQLTPSFPFGNLKDVILMNDNMGVVYDKIYNEASSEPAIGLYKLFTPQLVIRDNELVKEVLIKEFSSFHDNEVGTDDSDDPLFSQNPFGLKGEKWKEARKISMAGLTPGRIKKMVDHMKTVCTDLKDYLNENQGTDIEGKELGGNFTADVVSGCVYGLSCNSFKDPNSEMRENIKNCFNLDNSLAIKFMILSLVPQLAHFLRIRLFGKGVDTFFMKVVEDSIKYRKSNDYKRDDFLQHLIQTSEKERMTTQQIMSHSMTFVIDGYETSSLLISHIFDMLAENTDVQVKLREEINSRVKSIDDLSFDLLHSLRYLEAVVNETLRIRPPGSVLFKIVTKDVTIRKDGRTYNLQKGTSIAIPILSIQKDPKYFDQPDLFKPERFIENPHPEAFLPFSLGPRQCLGYKFALTQVKACIVTVCKYFYIIPKESTPKSFEMDVKSAILTYKKGGVWLKFRAIK